MGNTVPSEEQLRELQELLRTLPMGVSLAGLRFARHRWLREEYGNGRLGGRPNIVRSETSSITPSEALERIEWKSWKWWIRYYRKKGYSKMTISRIKQELKRLGRQTD